MIFSLQHIKSDLNSLAGNRIVNQIDAEYIERVTKADADFAIEIVCRGGWRIHIFKQVFVFG